MRQADACDVTSRGAPLRLFGPRLTAVVALLTGRYRLSRREVQQVLVDRWDIRLSLGSVLRQERAQGAAQAPVVAEVRTAVQRRRWSMWTKPADARGSSGPGCGRR